MSYSSRNTQEIVKKCCRCTFRLINPSALSSTYQCFFTTAHFSDRTSNSFISCCTDSVCSLTTTTVSGVSFSFFYSNQQSFRWKGWSKWQVVSVMQQPPRQKRRNIRTPHPDESPASSPGHTAVQHGVAGVTHCVICPTASGRRFKSRTERLTFNSHGQVQTGWASSSRLINICLQLHTRGEYRSWMISGLSVHLY